MSDTDVFDPVRNGVTESVVYFAKFGIAPLIAIFVFGVISVSFYLVLHYKLLPSYAKEETKLNDLNTQNDETEEEEPMTIKTSNWSTKHKVIYYGLFFSSALVTVSMWLVWMFLTAFDILHVVGGIILSFVTLFIYWIVLFCRSGLFFLPQFRYKPKNNPLYIRVALRLKSFCLEVKNKVRARYIVFEIGTLICAILAFVTCFFIAGLCMCGDPDYSSTRYMRSRLDPPCKPGVPCHVYLTLPEHPTTEMNVNFQTATDPKSPVIVYFDTISHNGTDNLTDYKYYRTGASYSMGDVLEISRWVHWVHLTALKPNSTYYFIAGHGDSISNYTIERKFKTIPDGPSQLNFVAGGDMGVIPVAEEIAKVMAEKEPQFALLGGDISYANSMPQCWPRWDVWLFLWENLLVTPSGYTVPMIMSIGNHEAGYDLPVKKVPFFLNYFNQQSLSSISFDSPPNVRKTYHSHYLGDDTVIIVLDSGHSSSFAVDSPQSEWLKMQLRSNVPNKFAVYHVPMYPSKRSYNYSRSKNLRNSWAPLFDDGKLKIGFENHDHGYKRTKRLKGGQEDVNGTLYIGDGCLGVPARARSDKVMRWYEEVYHPYNHFFDVNVNGSYVYIEAVDQNSTVFDSFSIDGYL